jgi:hypothetical protein
MASRLSVIQDFAVTTTHSGTHWYTDELRWLSPRKPMPHHRESHPRPARTATSLFTRQDHAARGSRPAYSSMRLMSYGEYVSNIDGLRTWKFRVEMDHMASRLERRHHQKNSVGR